MDHTVSTWEFNGVTSINKPLLKSTVVNILHIGQVFV